MKKTWVWRILNHWVWRILQTQPLSLDFFEKRMSLEILNRNLENSPNSTLEFGEFSKLNLWVLIFFNSLFCRKNESGDFELWVWRILQTQKKNSFESEFGEFSKLSTWVWRILQTHFGFWKKNMFSGFCFFWIWVRGNLQTQPLSLENSPNSTSECVYFLSFDFFFEKNEFGDFEPEFGDFLQTQPLSLENSPNSTLEFGEFSKLRKKSFESEFGEFSKLSTWVWRILQTHFGFWKKTCFRDFVSFESEFGEISKLNPWVCRILQTQPLSVCIF